MSIETLNLSEDALLIFREEDGLIQLLDKSAHMLWQASCIGLDAESIHTALPSVMGKPTRAEIQDLQNQWFKNGIIAPFSSELSYTLKVRSGLYTVTVNTNHLGLYQHLQLIWGSVSVKSVHTTSNTILDIRWLSSERIFLIHNSNSTIPISCADLNAVINQCNLGICKNSFNEKSRLFIAHAAALLTPCGKTLILPASAGSGKSTLTAALLQKGYQLINDDVVPVNMDGSISVTNMPLKIKSGAWELLSKLYPELGKMPIIERQDGVRFKYLPITSEKRCDPGSTHLTSLLVSPLYSPNLPPQSIELSKSQALSTLLAANPSFPHPFTSEYFQKIINWVSSQQAFSLRYRNTEEALTLVDQLLIKNSKELLNV